MLHGGNWITDLAFSFGDGRHIFVNYARDSIPVCWKSHQRPSNKCLQPQVADQNMKECMKRKIDVVKRKKYRLIDARRDTVHIDIIWKRKDVELKISAINNVN